MPNPDFLTQITKAAFIAPVSFTEFLVAYKKQKKTIFCFFEGAEDFIYYKPRIKRVLPQISIFEFNCSGKSDVLLTQRLINQHRIYRYSMSAYFIDRDFDPKTNCSEIYETPTYSIENFFCNNSTLSEVLINNYQIKRNSSDYKTCLKIFNELRDDFINKILKLNCWLHCIADKRNYESTGGSLKIDPPLEIIFKQVVKVDMTAISPLTEIDSLSKIEFLYNRIGAVNLSKLNSKLSFYSSLPDKAKMIRGKFLFRYISSYLQRLESDIGQSTPSITTKKYNILVSVNAKNMVSFLSGYAETPGCLNRYLLRFKILHSERTVIKYFFQDLRKKVLRHL